VTARSFEEIGYQCARRAQGVNQVTTADEIRSALNSGALFIEYLPTLSLVDERCVGAEALMRWRRERAILPASAFVPLVENTPLSGPLTYWVIDTVAAQLGEWLDANPEAHISINVPPEILGRGGLEYASRRSGLSTRLRQIIIEITERGVPDRLGLDALNMMSNLGIRVALDDTMMTGANLALLTRTHFEIVKLDRQVISQLQPGQPAPPWLSGLQALLISSSLTVIAEGVETRYQAERLREIGVQMAQGHLFSTTLSAPDLIKFHANSCIVNIPRR
jgi:EAL domain-containing protein (putative c-di-GMP-specific phosphodiesterase class I)